MCITRIPIASHDSSALRQMVAAGAGILRLEYIRPFDDLPVADKIVEYLLTIAD